jgi:hypothetical protein
MKVDFNRGLIDLEGEVIKNAKGESATLKGVTIDALLVAYQDEQNLSGEDKVKRFALASKINKGTDEVTVEEISLIKKLIGKAYSALVVGQAWDILEGK